MSVSMEGRVAYISGGSCMMARGTATAFLEAGGKVVLGDMKQELLDAAKADLVSKGFAAENIATAIVNVTDWDSIRSSFDQAEAAFGTVDVLVNIAGMNFLEKAVDVKEEVWDYLMDLNLKGSFFLTQQVAQDSLLDRGGNVIFIASQHAVVGNQMRAAYCASKSGLLGLMRVLALEWAAFGVRVNTVSPTYILNDKNRDVLRNANYKRKYLQRIPLKRYAQPEDVANAILFLSSDQASMITGHNLMVDGGYTAV